MLRKHCDKVLTAGIVCRHASHKVLDLKPFSGSNHNVYSMAPTVETQPWDRNSFQGGAYEQ